MAKFYGVTKTPTLLLIDNNNNKIAEGNEAFAALCKLQVQ
jgi:hypothetical protein